MMRRSLVRVGLVGFEEGSESWGYVGGMSRFRMHPTSEQAGVMPKHCAHARYVWNLAVEQHAHAFGVLPPAALHWCGFVAADGTIVERAGGSSETALHPAVRDQQHAHAFRSFLRSTHAITHVPKSPKAYPGSTEPVPGW
ncbi:helix-turn-helix domain-containing protein [Streptomyces sp. NPDC001292]|uniref:helix-turn-helix domain-containing protein n=1 Tax=Streptomyces sp. NPDC001292 TaxID=3364558 RepID=UPI0036CA3015